VVSTKPTNNTKGKINTTKKTKTREEEGECI
jgi:hypothetical protein